MAIDFNRMFSGGGAIPHIHPHSHTDQDLSKIPSPHAADRRRKRLKAERKARRTMYKIRKQNGRKF